MNDNILLKNEDGTELKYRVLFTFDSQETNKTYIIYTNDEKDINGNIKAFVLCYMMNDPQKELMQVNTEKEINTIISLFEEYLNDNKK